MPIINVGQNITTKLRRLSFLSLAVLASRPCYLNSKGESLNVFDAADVGRSTAVPWTLKRRPHEALSFIVHEAVPGVIDCSSGTEWLIAVDRLQGLSIDLAFTLQKSCGSRCHVHDRQLSVLRRTAFRTDKRIQKLCLRTKRKAHGS